ncbi:hypothetical protein TRFO_18533 [Tritrichomonas foetus]|uniref:Uncharacterized protein n=1 Tax=Tritrichomonas foetus TaxID=1144522 RepID=A0A1J4KQV8_9EUKA|nr:hypothetical protein TRFO_18533 [Tritrichomonas foetus]|eukprot:OHT11853.1 hypothetical protein TRFO_18533 [Tritrichomonas foetus]
MSRYQKTSKNEDAVKKSLDRMKIMSMVPLELEPANSSPEFLSALDQNWDIYRNAISDFSQTLEYGQKENFNLYEEPKKKQEFRYERTSYQPSFQHVPSMLPEPATYYPDYEAIVPTAPKYKIAEIPKKPTPLLQATTAAIINQYSNNMRGFDPSNVKNVSDNLISSSDIKMPDHRIHSTFADQSTRHLEFAKPSLTAEHDFYSPPSPKKKGVTFDNLTDRVHIVKEDSGRNYDEKAFQQFMKLHNTVKVPTITKQVTRDYQAPKNPRVAFLESITAEQNNMLKKLTKERSSSQMKPRTVPGSFAAQASRERAASILDAPEHFRDSKYNIDPSKSLKHVWPRVPYTTIRPPPKFESPKKDEKFWSAF